MRLGRIISFELQVPGVDTLPYLNFLAHLTPDTALPVQVDLPSDTALNGFQYASASRVPKGLQVGLVSSARAFSMFATKG